MDDTIPIDAPGAKEAGEDIVGEEVEVLAFGVINTLSRAQRVGLPELLPCQHQQEEG